MIPPNLRSRISELKRSAIRKSWFSVRAPAGEPDAAETLELPPPSFVAKATATDVRLRLLLDDVADGRQKTVPPGRFYLIDQGIEALMPLRGPELKKRFLKLLDQTRGNATVNHDDFGTFQELSGTEPSELVFVDIEATGFTPGTPLFLVGLVVVEEGDLRVQQYLARDYTEEGALLYQVWKRLADTRTVVTFNGKSYDLPYIRDRMVYYGYRLREGLADIDLLHEGRRRYKDRLVNCKLQTLEKAICGRGRLGDIPGAEIPDAYHEFVRTGNATEMRDILHHNALDLVTMIEIVLFMLEGREL